MQTPLLRKSVFENSSLLCKGRITRLMFSIFIVGIFLLIGQILNAQAKDPATGDNSRNSVDWSGLYFGVLPCADCPGIETWLTLHKDLTYTLRNKYQERKDTAIKSSGTFSWNTEGGKIVLNDVHGGNEAYQVGENQLFKLDQQGKRITGELAKRYVLGKVNTDIQEKYWKLTELNGKAVTFKEGFKKEPHIIFKSNDNRVNGNGGCNSFSGSYELRTGGRITMSQMISTMMACPDMETESQFFKVLAKADNYVVVGDTTLVLNKARMAPLARFRVVYLK
jgi:copper homeostasis protein (lipoprotein)